MSSQLSRAAARTAQSTASRIKTVVTPKGITAWLVEDYTVPLVAMEAAFRGGTSQESDAESGGLTMLAELLGEGRHARQHGLPVSAGGDSG